MKIKVCGITIFEQLQQLAALKIDYAGFIFHPASPRYVVDKLNPALVKSVLNIKKIGVFVNAEKETVLKMASVYGLDMVQLHGDESPEYCQYIQNKIPVVKVFRVSGDEEMSTYIHTFNDACQYFLFDTLPS